MTPETLRYRDYINYIIERFGLRMLRSEYARLDDDTIWPNHIKAGIRSGQLQILFNHKGREDTKVFFAYFVSFAVKFESQENTVNVTKAVNHTIRARNIKVLSQFTDNSASIDTELQNWCVLRRLLPEIIELSKILSNLWFGSSYLQFCIFIIASAYAELRRNWRLLLANAIIIGQFRL